MEKVSRQIPKQAPERDMLEWGHLHIAKKDDTVPHQRGVNGISSCIIHWATKINSTDFGG